ncbi:MAG: dihydroneopterin aldolase [Muribaculaceae bacterium]|nr:dihydroneopterin aldolase [Muribaculaceae bacterium]
MDSIELTALRFFARHGVLPQETLAGNEFEVDLRLDFDAREAMESDKLEATVNYAEVAKLVEEEMQQPSQLLEHVAGRIRRRILAEYPGVCSGMVRVSKLAPPIPRQMERVAFTTSWSGPASK